MVLKSSRNILTALILLYKYDLTRQGSLKVRWNNKHARVKSIGTDVASLVWYLVLMF